MIEARDYVKDMGDLQRLELSDGWKLLVSAAKKELDELTAKILDPKTPVSEVESLRQARGRLVDDFMPDKILINLNKRTRPLAEKQTQQAKTGSPDA